MPSGRQPVSTSSDTGKHYEQIALNYLLDRGLKKKQLNFRCRFGEIDLIMSDARELVFVEVRYRRQTAYGGAAASVTLAKQRKLIRTAHCYLQRHHHTKQCRFDVLDICGTGFTAKNSKSPPYRINWIKNAFSA